MKKIIYILLGAMVFASCDGLTDKNEITKDAAEVPAITLFSNAQKEMAEFHAEPQINRLLSQQWSEVQYIDQSRYDFYNGGTPAWWWRSFYRDVLIDLDEFTKLALEDDSYLSEAVRTNQIAAGEVLKVYAWYTLVTSFGNIPYSEALDFENSFPKYDDQTTIYMDLLARLDAAIADMDVDAGFGSQASADLIYEGDMDGWFAFANSLKFRMGMLLADVDPATAEAAVAEASPNAFASADLDATFQFLGTPPNTDPVWSDLVQSGRNDYVASNTMVDFMNDLNDPRIGLYYTEHEGAYVGGEYGNFNVYADFSHINPNQTEPDFTHVILDYSEVEFLRAEAVERGFLAGSAAEHYENAIRASFEYWSGVNEIVGGAPIADAAIDAYLAQPSVAYATAEGGYRQKIGLQKYIALYNRGYDAWTEWRRLDYPILNVPYDMDYEDIPLRYLYPISEQNVNTANYNEAVSAMGSDDVSVSLFWDVN
ncbi:SusD/RagB family nutrient-binding outer membrane lipoprotein [Echinicola vietnamensis]|uniref:Susd and RagB outer membrane lipoprotein n=1 Tax=Echinicola vietnamensis (strain DSM 17526 / LMG 23754 / KMM 6221) TaxID=926556 RepID=L0FWE6_ECHVK|nr:SusD/RagB family nutrient-binding outer membrane lipoprotein [Echinicola vietnamensis]AGA77061.1 hypothetical protein Echvi_0786 [Echinicola vietnamensis DSM 17526]